jgi:dolichyl-phosphate-mannose-protein mannosyltransferase
VQRREIISIIGFVGLLYIALYHVLTRRISYSPVQGQDEHSMKALYLYLSIGILLRLVIAGLITGYEADIQTFTAWAHTASTQGLSAFYSQGIFADYPPGYIYVLYILGTIRRLFNIPFESASMVMLLKLPAIMADIVSSCLLFRLARRRFGETASAGIALLYLFNPAVLANSSAWGQVDSVFMLGVLILIQFLVQERLSAAFVAYAIILAVKPQALLLGPLLFMYLVRRRSFQGLAAAFLKGIGTFALIFLPFIMQKGLHWIVQLYAGTLSSYPYASLNAYNIWALTGNNFAPLDQTFLFVSFQAWAILFTCAVIGYAAFLYGKGANRSFKLPLLGTLILTGVFLFMTKMHERYLYYALLPCLLSFIYSRDRRLLYIFIGLSLTQLMNVAQVLLESYRRVYFIPSWDPLLIIISLANIGLFAYLCYVSWTMLLRDDTRLLESGRNKPSVPPSGKNSPGSPLAIRIVPKEFKLQWSRKDTFLLALLVGAYSVLSLVQLGSTKLPETYWKPASAGEEVTIDLGSPLTIDRLTLLPGIGEGSFTLAFSANGRNWTGSMYRELTVPNVFTWQIMAPSRDARYVKIRVDRPGFTLYELAFYEPGQKTPIRVVGVDERINTLFDEQEKAAYRASFMNGMYFDEIYHARTAYEHTVGMEPYESTHPPLGKLLIAAGTLLFGMNPFGWRIAGAVFGISMLPVMYLFGMRMFGQTRYAFAATLLLGFDCLHFVQSRIATIDVFAGFFILLMFYFMYRYCTTSFYEVSLLKSFIPLAWSGMFFALGVATKWISLYAGSGLAILFFLSLLLRYQEYREARRQLERNAKPAKRRHEPVESIRHKVQVFPAYACFTILWCAGWFVLVPAIVYAASYIPWFQAAGTGRTLSDLLTYQKHMLSYHAGLEATHPFSSSWWQWPLMSKPVWYYGGTELPGNRVSSIVAIGNPLVWWVGLLSMITVAAAAWTRRQWIPLFLLIAFLSQYVPWLFVARITFLYHYLAMVPFIILAITYVSQRLIEAIPAAQKYFYAYLTAVAAVFLLFYPVLTGLTVPRAYAVHLLQWSKHWIFF